MLCAALLCVGLLAGDVAGYARSLAATDLDQETLEAEGYGHKEAFHREGDGLRIQLPPGEPETGWKTPQALRIGGDFTITADLVIDTLPKPAQEDGVAVGLSVATQNLDQPDATLVRLAETDGSIVYRTIDQAKNASQQQQMQMQMQMMAMQGGQPDGRPLKPPKPPRPTFPAEGAEVRFELHRVGATLEYSVRDAASDRTRYLGQLALGTGDLVGVKLFVSNRNGAEAVDARIRRLSIQAARVSGLGTEVRTVFGEVVHGEPTAIEDGLLLVGAPTPGAASSPSSASVVTVSAAGPDGEKLVVANTTVVVDGVIEGVVVAAPATTETAEQVKMPDSPGDSPDEAKPDEANPEEAEAAEPEKVEPKAKLPLIEVEEIVFDRALAATGRFIGQPNVDLTGPGLKEEEEGDADPDTKADDVLAPPPGTITPKKIPKVEPEPNGIRDLHFSLSGLRDAAITQVMVSVETDDGQTTWQIDTSGSRAWPLVLRRSGTEPWADLFLEPPPGDAFEKDLTVTITYGDGQNANSTVKVGEHTDPALAFEADSPLVSPDARAHLAGAEQLYGTVEGLDDQHLRLSTPWGARLEVPLAIVAGLYMGLADHKESPESFARRLEERGSEDLLLARSKDDEVVAIAGIVEGIEGDKLRFNYQDRTRTLSLKQVEGIVLAARPAPRPPDGPRQVFTMAGGVTVSGTWKAIGDSTWTIQSAWGQDLELPAAEIQRVRFQGGAMTSLSDLEPDRVDEVPYFGRPSPWRRDEGLGGGPLTIDGTTYARGLAVHSRCVLTYDLGGRFAWFETLVGFDDAAKEKGRVECRVVADGEDLYNDPDLRADAPPVALAMPVSGVRQLQLIVDFGPDQDAGDRVIWADPRLYRERPPGREETGEGGPAD